ncbi:DUF4229 domain-containing protein [Lysinimonas soli]|uniref:DUF4229 domain-containing protein n=1 Tax=Lysinimonas soli TaxID=1074233 RepID=A0ABW0NRJ9_9MICO
MRAWILFSAVRLGLFAVLFGVLYALAAPTWPSLAWLIAAVGAAVLAFCISYIFFAPLRERVAREIAETRAGKARPASAGPSDEDIEDAAGR